MFQNGPRLPRRAGLLGNCGASRGLVTNFGVLGTLVAAHLPARWPATDAMVRHTIGEGMIFVSYSRRDSATVVPIVQHLTNLGCDVWFDVNSIDFGALFVSRIANALNKADVFLAFFTTNYTCSKWCTVESDMALAMQERGEIVIIPMAVSANDIPDRFKHINAYIGPADIVEGNLISQILKIEEHCLNRGHVSVFVEPDDLATVDVINRLRLEAVLLGMKVSMVTHRDVAAIEQLCASDNAIIIMLRTAADIIELARKITSLGRTIFIVCTDRTIYAELTSFGVVIGHQPGRSAGGNREPPGSTRLIFCPANTSNMTYLGLDSAAREIIEYINKVDVVRICQPYYAADGGVDELNESFHQIRQLDVECLHVYFNTGIMNQRIGETVQNLDDWDRYTVINGFTKYSSHERRWDWVMSSYVRNTPALTIDGLVDWNAVMPAK